MSLAKRQYALIAVARKTLGMGEAEYRAALAQLCGVTSATELDAEGFELLLAFLEWRGVSPGAPRGEDYGQRPDMASFAQLEPIRTLWVEYTDGRAGEAESIRRLARSFKVSSPRFPTLDHARKAILALEAMKARARAA